jgi:CRP/FNR family transcriptional regulator, anaerobic regulatory protein
LTTLDTLASIYPELMAPGSETRFSRVKRLHLEAGSVLFRPGDAAPGYVLLLSGRVGVYLTGQNGRELRLYTVGPGTSCIQTTLGLLGGEAYSGEAVAETAVEAALLPPADFKGLMNESAPFRNSVLRSFGARMADVTRTLEQVAFISVEARLAGYLLAEAGEGDRIEATHSAIATSIGSVREVVSRRLESLEHRGLLTLDRASIRILDRAKLGMLASAG